MNWGTDNAELTEVLERGLAAARRAGASAAKILCSRDRATSCAFEAGRLKRTGSETTALYEITVVKDGRRGVTQCNTTSDIDEMVARAVTLAKVGSIAHFEQYPAPGTCVALNRHARSTASLSRADLTAAGQAMTDVLAAHDAALHIEAEADRSETATLLLTSGGVRYSGARTQWGLGAGAQRTEGTDMLFGWYGRAWGEVNAHYDPGVIGGRVCEDLRLGSKTVPAPEGKTMLFVPPELMARVLEPLVMGVSGKNVAKGDSPLRGRLGEQVLSPSLTLRDDPHVDYCPDAAAIDNDGVPTGPCDIVRDGVLTNFLYDLDTAGMAGVEPTGHNGCRPYSPELRPGSRTHEALLAGIEDGIYLRFGIGFGQSNMMNGDVACNVGLGFRIRHGELVGRVKDTMIACNVYDVLKSGIELSSDLDPLLRMPYAVLEGVTASTAG